MPPDAKRLKLDCNDNEYSHLPLNRDLRRIFASYYLLNKLSSKLQYSYYSSITENSYLIGSTKITDVLRIYFTNKFWSQTIRAYMRSLPYKVILEENGGRRLNYPCKGRVLSDSNSLKYSRSSQKFILLSRNVMSYAIRCDELQELFDLELLRCKAAGLDYGVSSKSSIKHTILPYLEWFSDLEEIDFSPTFPRKVVPILCELIEKCGRSLKRLYLPNFINAYNLPLRSLRLEHLKKCFSTCLMKSEEQEPIQSFLPYFAVSAKTLEFNMDNLTYCLNITPHFHVNPDIETLELSFKYSDETTNEAFYTWVDSLFQWKSNIKKLVFMAYSLYIAKGEKNCELGADFFSKNQFLLRCIFDAKHKILPFELCAQFDIRCGYCEIKPNLLIEGDVITLELSTSANHDVYIAFKRDQKLIGTHQKLESVNYDMEILSQWQQLAFLL